MADTRLKIRRRAFPSHGIVRITTDSLYELDILEGDAIDLINEGTGATSTVTAIADTLVENGVIRVSETDLNAVGLKDGDTILVRKTPPVQEKVKKAVNDAGKTLSGNIDSLNASVRKTAESVKTEASKTAQAVETGTRSFADKAGKAATGAKEKIKKELDGKDWL